MTKQIASSLPAIAVAVPAVTAGLIFFIGEKNDKLRSGLSVAAALASLVTVLAMLPASLKGHVFGLHMMHIIPKIWLYFRVDQLGVLFAIVTAALWVLATIYSIGYMKDEHAKTRYYSFLLLCLAWTLGVGLAGNLFTLLIFYELFSISTYPLIVHEGNVEAMAAGKKYIIYILIGGSIVLFSIVLTYFLANTMSLGEPGILSLKSGRVVLITLFWCYILGFGVKGAIMPLHAWVPDAHPIAPSPFSALLSGVMVAAGAYGIMRTVYNVFGVRLIEQLGVGMIAGYFVCFTIIVSSLFAIEQDNLKRRLAYSTIGQMSYIILGTVLVTTHAAWGGMVHIANHAFMKGTLFLCAGIIIKQLGKRNISEMRGIGKKIPITMTAFTIAALGMIGTPPLAGFVSKWYLALGSLDADSIFFVVILLLSSLLGAVYFLPIIYTAFFQSPKDEEDKDNSSEKSHHKEEDEDSEGFKEAPWVMVVPVIIGAIGVIVLGLFSWTPGLPLSLAKAAADIFIK